MAMFQQYQNGVTPVTGMAEAGANIGNMYARGMADFGKSLSDGLKAYNDNSAKDKILTQEAEVLGSQIQQYAQMFGNSPEHAEFTKSLQPYIDQLAKVPSQSLTQKMGTVTGVKAGFANIGQQLQVFELMRGERMKRDMNTAMGGVKEFDEVTVPTAIIPSGKLPYFYDKTYIENEAEVTRLATEAKGRGANVDISKVLSEWRNDFKASAMSRTDIPPEVKEALIKQIDAGQNLVDNIQTDEETGVTDYAKEASMYERTATSVKDQLAPPKVQETTETPENPVSKKWKEIVSREETDLLFANDNIDLLSPAAKSSNIGDKVSALSRYYQKLLEKTHSSWDEDKEKVKLALQSGDTDKMDSVINEQLDYFKESAKDRRLKIASAKLNIEETEKPVGAEGVKDKAKEELNSIDAQIKAIDESIERGETLEPSFWSRIGDSITKWRIESQIDNSKEFASEAIIRSGINITPENVKEFLNKNPDAIKGTSFPTGELRRITTKERQIIDSGVYPILSKLETKLYTTKSTDPLDIRKSLENKKSELENRIATGIVNAKPADISKAQQVGATAEAKPEPSYALTNQRNMSLGTTTQQVASSVESKRTDMKNFFTKKYGYIPASFEESFKAIYPEANFKTMETPYGAFMHDGKEWKQIQMQQPKIMSNKEIAEEKSVTFGQPNASGGLEFSELVPKSGIYVRGIFAGTPTEAFKFRTEMLETSNARVAIGRLIEINDMVGESMPWNAKLWGEAKALLPQIKAGLRTDIIGVGTVSNYEQQLIEDVVADPTKFWSLESSDRAKLTEIMRRVNNRLTDKPALYGLEVRRTGQSNAEIEKSLRLGRTGKSKLELDFEARGGKKGTALQWNLTNKIPDALK